MNGPLAVRPIAFADESITGYVMRTAERNGLGTPHALFTLIGVVDAGPRPLANLMVDHTHFAALASTIGIRETQLKAIAYTPLPTIARISRVSWRGHAVPTSALRFVRAPVCPECLAQSPYMRQAWDWGFFAACPVHGRLLLEDCPHCNKPVNRYRASVTNCECGFAYADATTDIVPCEGTLWLSEQLAAVPRAPDGQGLLDAVATTTGILATATTLDASDLSLGDLPLAVAHRAIEAACVALRDGKLEQLVREVGSARIAAWSALGPSAALLPFLRCATPTFLGLTIANLAKIGNSLSVAATTAAQAERMSDLLNAAGLQQVLGISTHVLGKAVKVGLIRQAKGRTSGDSWAALYAADEAARLLDLLRPRDQGEPRAGTMQRVGRVLRANAVSAATLFGGLADGSMEMLAYDPFFGLKQARVRLLPPVRESDGTVTVQALAQRLGVNVANIYSVIHAGKLPTQWSGGKNVIKNADVEAFVREYVFPRELAVQVKTSAISLARKLLTLGVKPASGPSIDGGVVYLFRRRDIHGIDLHAAGQIRGLRNRSGKRSQKQRSREKPKDYLTARQAAEEFGLSALELGALARRGLLKRQAAPVAPLLHKYFRRRDVAAYLQRYRNNPTLVEIGAAAQEYGLAKRKFHQHWRREGFETVDSGIGIYVRRSDFKEFRRRALDNLTTKQAAEMLDTTRHAILNWVKIGWLLPDGGPGIDDRKRYVFAPSVILKLKEAMATHPEERTTFLRSLGLARRRRIVPGDTSNVRTHALPRQ